MTEVGNKVRTFIADCIDEYPVEADRIDVSISVRWGTCEVSLSNFQSPLYYSKKLSWQRLRSGRI